MLSILIPTYNYDVVRLVKELVEQASKEHITFEIIVIEDGSTEFLDQNQKIKKEESVHFIVNSENLGRSATRQLLAEKSSFENILFLDADVMPLKPDFINTYITEIEEDFEIVNGGICYSPNPPEKSKMLRYVYGKKRETKSATFRNIEPHFIAAANFLIKKTVFLKLNTELENFYGDDLVLSNNIKQQKINVLHIENPVIHLGLETSTAYLQKSLAAVKAINTLEMNGKIGMDLLKIQKTYSDYKAMMPLFRLGFTVFSPIIRSNLKSKNPNLFFFDLYRLNAYAKLKKNV